MKNSKLRDCIKEELYSIIEHTLNESKTNSNLNVNLHFNRKQVKRLETLSILFKDEKSFKQISKELKVLKSLNKRSSQSRDAYVLLKLIEELIQKEKDVDLAEILNIKENFKNANDNILDEKQIEEYLNSYLNEYQIIKDKMIEVKLENSGFKTLKAAIKKIYKDSRILFKRISKEPDIKLLHRWRKSIKQLQYTMEFLDKTGCKKLKKLIKALDSLTVKLGNIKDLDNLFLYLDKLNKENSTAVQSICNNIIKEISTALNNSVQQGKTLYKKELNSRKISKLLSKNNFV